MKPLRYLSVCSGIEAATQAWHPLGWVPVAFSEIEPFPSAVLAHHYPTVPNWGDMAKFQEWPDADVDVLCGGTPCQSFSVAGLRQGLADPRGNLMLTYGAIARRYRPRWLVWKNVPGVLSSNGGRDFAAFVGLLGQLGYGWAYRVLDAQHVRTRRFPFAVPQRRRRVFVVGYLGDWRRAAAVLFDRESLSGHPAPRREAGQRPAPTISARPTGGGGLGADFDLDGGLIAASPVAGSLCADSHPGAYSGQGAYTGRLVGVAFGGNNTSGPIDVSTALSAHGGATGRLDFESETFVTTPIAIQERAVAFSVKDHGGVMPAVAFDMRGREGGAMPEGPHDTANIRAADGGSSRSYVAEPWAVRRLTPRECGRLQGFPDDFTRIPYRGKPAELCPDGPQYKTYGNSWAVNVVEWIGERIAEVDAWESAA